MFSPLRFFAIAAALSVCVGPFIPQGRADDGHGVASASPEPLVEVTHRVSDETVVTRGRVVLTAADGGLLLETRDGRLVTVTPRDFVQQTPVEAAFIHFSSDELQAALQAEFGPTFHVHSTRRYVIVTDTSREYALWCGRLFERLQTAFFSHWKRDPLELHDPAQPLVAVIFADPQDYAAYAVAEAGEAVARTQGYYSVRSNRILLSDLTRSADAPLARTEDEIERRLELRLANLVTVVHEATHQIAFNSGLQTRYADNPMWLSEGLAMYFEAPDLRSTTGWRTIGKVHPGRLQQFQEFASRRRQPGSLASLVLTEDRFRDPDTMSDAYAESWAFVYFLMREHRRELASYLERLGRKPRLIWDAPETRGADFQAAFGVEPVELENEFLKFTARLRAP